MQIRALHPTEIDTAIQFYQAMLNAMESFGGHRLQELSAYKDWLRDSIQSQLTSADRLYLVAESDDSTDQLIGLVEASIYHLPLIFQPRSSVHIHAIYVAPEYRRRGVARSLLEAALEWGRSQGCIEADLNVLQRSTAKSLYESMGFEPFEIEMRRKL